MVVSSDELTRFISCPYFYKSCNRNKTPSLVIPKTSDKDKRIRIFSECCGGKTIYSGSENHPWGGGGGWKDDRMEGWKGAKDAKQIG